MDCLDTGSLISDWEAVNIYGLKKSHLKGLSYERRYMPGVPREGMRLKRLTALYQRADIERIKARIVQAQQERAKRKRAKYEAQKQRRHGVVSSARDQVQKFANISNSKCSIIKYGDVKLPESVLQHVVAFVAAVEADGIRGPSMVANDLANMALVSWDFHNAAKQGFAALERQVQSISLKKSGSAADAYKRRIYSRQVRALAVLPASGGYSLQEWQQIIADPMSYTNQQLVQAATELEVARTGPKSLLVVRVLGAFGLREPSKVPVKLLRTISLERNSTEPWAECSTITEAHDNLRALSYHRGADEELPVIRALAQDLKRQGGHLTMSWSAALLRRMLFAAGVRDKQQLLQLNEELRAQRLHKREQSRLAALQTELDARSEQALLQLEQQQQAQEQQPPQVA